MSRSSIRCLEVEELSCATEDRLLFSDLSFSLDEGCLTTLRGANGSGKSCLLQSLCGVAQQGIRTKGRVRYRNRLVSFSELAYKAMLVGHRAPFLSGLSLFENLRFWAKIFSPREHETTLPSAARWFALEDFWHLSLSRLSAGERQRGALAMLALRPHARLWLLDEPQASLDARARRGLHRCLLAHLERGGAAVVALHESLPLRLQSRVRCDLTLAAGGKGYG